MFHQVMENEFFQIVDRHRELMPSGGIKTIAGVRAVILDDRIAQPLQTFSKNFHLVMVERGAHRIQLTASSQNTTHSKLTEYKWRMFE